LVRKAAKKEKKSKKKKVRASKETKPQPVQILTKKTTVASSPEEPSKAPEILLERRGDEKLPVLHPSEKTKEPTLSTPNPAMSSKTNPEKRIPANPKAKPVETKRYDTKSNTASRGPANTESANSDEAPVFFIDAKPDTSLGESKPPSATITKGKLAKKPGDSKHSSQKVKPVLSPVAKEFQPTETLTPLKSSKPLSPIAPGYTPGSTKTFSKSKKPLSPIAPDYQPATVPDIPNATSGETAKVIKYTTRTSTTSTPPAKPSEKTKTPIVYKTNHK
jgi:hypothetical protein